MYSEPLLQGARFRATSSGGQGPACVFVLLGLNLLVLLSCSVKGLAHSINMASLFKPITIESSQVNLFPSAPNRHQPVSVGALNSFHPLPDYGADFSRTGLERLKRSPLTGVGVLATLHHSSIARSIPTPVSVNWHFTRKCNYACSFCFHTPIEGYLMPIDEAKRGLALLKESGMEKINFSGGEPFLFKSYLGELVRYCKESLHVESVSIVSNGSLIDEEWMQQFGEYLDILAISCDSFDTDVLRSIGRCTKAGDTDHINQTLQVRSWCEKFNVAFKLNTVVTKCNVHEDISQQVKLLNPKRWKVFQVLPIDGENVGENPTGRDARELKITQEAFDSYIDRHRSDPFISRVIVPENNAYMRDSYLILDQRMRFLDCRCDKKTPSASILGEGGVEVALAEAGHDVAMFHARGGRYKWRKQDMLGMQRFGGHMAGSNSDNTARDALK